MLHRVILYSLNASLHKTYLLKQAYSWSSNQMFSFLTHGLGCSTSNDTYLTIQLPLVPFCHHFKQGIPSLASFFTICHDSSFLQGRPFCSFMLCLATCHALSLLKFRAFLFWGYIWALPWQKSFLAHFFKVVCSSSKIAVVKCLHKRLHQAINNPPYLALSLNK